MSKPERVRSTISLSAKEFAWARQQTLANDWERAGETEGISRYVQELIRKDMPPEWQPPHVSRLPAKPKPIRLRRGKQN